MGRRVSIFDLENRDRGNLGGSGVAGTSRVEQQQLPIIFDKRLVGVPKNNYPMVGKGGFHARPPSIAWSGVVDHADADAGCLDGVPEGNKTCELRIVAVTQNAPGRGNGGELVEDSGVDEISGVEDQLD